MALLSIIFGSIVGVSLGLTGGGGSIFAVPLLVYGMGVRPQMAVSVSLAAVGATALFGAIKRYTKGELEFRTGLIFAGAGMLGAPVGAIAGSFLPDLLLLVLFAFLMIYVALRMWRKAGSKDENPFDPPEVEDRGPACRRDPEGILRLNSRCMMLLTAVGFGAGVLSGLFGVGGGFIIVPALVFFTQMDLKRALGTSLMIIFLVGISGVVSFAIGGKSIDPLTTSLFVLGGILGMEGGIRLSRYLSGPTLQKFFAVSIIGMALFILVRSYLAV